MEDALRHPVLQQPPPSPSPDAPIHRSTISPFYYSLLGIASIALILLAYNIVVVGWCWQHHRARRRFDGYPNRTASNAPPPKSVEGIPLHKYRKEETLTPVQASPECPVCLSAFADGEGIRQLPKCKHLFHADCIDMWLYSHSNCPICRAEVGLTPALSGRNSAMAPADWERRRSAEAMMAFGNVV